jgi:Flp pilus assembly protein CpaB
MFLVLSLVLSSCGSSSDKSEGSGAVKTAVEPMVPAVYAKSRLPRNKAIKPSQVEVRMVPVSKIPANEEYAVSLAEFTEALAVRDIEPDTLMIRSLWTYETVSKLSQLVSPGKTAIAIETDVASAMAFIAPNDLVDVIATYKVDRPDMKMSYDESRVIAVNCKVLAVHREFLVPESVKNKKTETGGKPAPIKNPFQGRDKIRSVTIEVEPYIAQKIALVTSDTKNNKIRLAANSAAGGVNDALGIAVSARSLSQMAVQEKVELQNKTKSEISDRVIKYTGSGRSESKIWSEKELNAPYDEDADAPLQQEQY